MDVFQSSSPIHDIPQEVTMEEEEVSSIRVNMFYAQLHIDSFEWLCISYCWSLKFSKALPIFDIIKYSEQIWQFPVLKEREFSFGKK